jgi:putative hydrolase of the HAD superfamily
MLKVILFDLDETLYPRSSSLMPEIARRIEKYVIERVGIAAERADELRRHWRVTYGTALRGMIEEGYDFSVDDYLQYVHDIKLDGLIEAQPEVRQMLHSIPLRRVVLTNSDVQHATRVLSHVNLLDCFERIIDIRALNFINKPDQQAYRLALGMLGVRADETIFVEDTPVNTRPAKALGMRTILVDYPSTADADFCVASLLDVGPIVTQLLAADADALATN